MIRTRKVLQTFGLNILRILWEKFLKAWGFFRLGTIFAGLWWVLTRPYEWFGKHMKDEDIAIAKGAANVASGGGGLGSLFFLPYDLYLSCNGDLEMSEFDRDALKFWFAVGIWTMIAAGILALTIVSTIEPPVPSDR